jgi:hypothetical protein
MGRLNKDNQGVVKETAIKIGKKQNNTIEINSSNGNIGAYYFIQAERKDVEKVLLEYKPTK